MSVRPKGLIGIDNVWFCRERQLRLYGDSLQRIPPIGFFFVEIRGAGPRRGGVDMLHVCVRWSPIWRMWASRAWRLPGRWPDGGRRSTVPRWTRRRAAAAYAPILDLTWPESDQPELNIEVWGSSRMIDCMIWRAIIRQKCICISGSRPFTLHTRLSRISLIFSYFIYRTYCIFSTEYEHWSIRYTRTSSQPENGKALSSPPWGRLNMRWPLRPKKATGPCAFFSISVPFSLLCWQKKKLCPEMCVETVGIMIRYRK